MKEIASEGKEDVRTAFLSCLLIVCFEGILGRYNIALAQARIGLQIMQEWVKKRSKLGDKVDLYSPAPFDIEDGLFHVFRQLDVISTYFCGTNSSLYHYNRSLEGADVVERMPRLFTDIIEARNYL